MRYLKNKRKKPNSNSKEKTEDHDFVEYKICYPQKDIILSIRHKLAFERNLTLRETNGATAILIFYGLKLENGKNRIHKSLRLIVRNIDAEKHYANR